MLILIPSSEGKSSYPGEGVFRRIAPEYADAAGPVVQWLRAAPVSARAQRCGVRPEKAAEVHAQNLQALDAPGMKAIERYEGVVYKNIDYPTLKHKAEANRRILIVSAFFGLIPAKLPIPAYKLAFDPWLVRYWTPINSARLAALAKGKPVLSLLPQVHGKTIAYPGVVSVDFKVQGGRKSSGHFGKAIKGRFVRFLVENKVESIADFGAFREDGYRFDGVNFVQG